MRRRNPWAEAERIREEAEGEWPDDEGLRLFRGLFWALPASVVLWIGILGLWEVVA